MILAEPVVSSFGQILLPASTELYESHKRILKTWNIKVIMVKSKENDQTGEISEEIIKLARNRLIQRIHWEPRNAIEKDLINIGIIKIAQSIIAKGK